MATFNNFSAKMPNDEGKALNSNHAGFSYDEVFPALPVDMKPKNQTGQEPVQPNVPFSSHIRSMRISTSEMTTVRAAE